MFSTTKIDLRSLFQFLMNHVFGFATDGGDEGNRTLDPLLAGQVLSQLSYTPIFGYSFFNSPWKSNNNFKTESCLRRLFVSL